MTACLSPTLNKGKKAALLTGSVIRGSDVSLFTASFDIHKKAPVSQVNGKSAGKQIS